MSFLASECATPTRDDIIRNVSRYRFDVGCRSRSCSAKRDKYQLFAVAPQLDVRRLKRIG